MLEPVLLFVRDKVNQHLVNYFGLSDSVVVLNNLLEQDGSAPQKNSNKIVITLINLEKENAKQFYGGQKNMVANAVGKIYPSIHFNLDLLFTASFDDYGESLKFLGETIAFFQSFQTMDRENSPDLPAEGSALKFEVESISYTETHNLWSAMGAKFRPSIIYKVRHVTIQSDQVRVKIPQVSDVGTGVTS